MNPDKTLDLESHRRSIEKNHPVSLPCLDSYIGVSKLSCKPCYHWIQAYNEVQTRPKYFMKGWKSPSFTQAQTHLGNGKLMRATSRFAASGSATSKSSTPTLHHIIKVQPNQSSRDFESTKKRARPVTDVRIVLHNGVIPVSKELEISLRKSSAGH